MDLLFFVLFLVFCSFYCCYC